jgi:hypothetical protein
MLLSSPLPCWWSDDLSGGRQIWLAVIAGFVYWSSGYREATRFV